MRPIKRALVSVSDKTDIAEFARQLHQRGIEILSTGGTAELIQKSGVPVTLISDYTGFPEMMDGRIKTLHPKVHGGILARREAGYFAAGEVKMYAADKLHSPKVRRLIAVIVDFDELKLVVVEAAARFPGRIELNLADRLEAAGGP